MAIDHESVTVKLLRLAFEKDIIDILNSRSAYGESWKHRRIIYFTDRIASKIQRVQNIENALLRDETLPQANIEEELKDIVVYGLMALIRISWIERANAPKKWIMTYFGAMKDE